MAQDLPTIRYERSMNHNYIVLSQCNFFEKGKNKSTDYRTRMILENKIPGLLPVTHRQINGESRYYYEINSLQSLDRLYDKNEIQYNGLKNLLLGCIKLFEKLDEYLLDGTQIIIKSELIYIHVEKMEPYFVCYPDYEGDVRIAFMEFIDEILTKIDHTDEQAVMLGYQVYRYTRNPNYVMSEIKAMIEHMMIAMNNKFSCEDSIIPQKHGWKTHDKTINPCLENVKSKWPQEQNGVQKFEQNKNLLEFYSQEPYDDNRQKISSSCERNSKKKNRNIAGGIFSILIALCVVFVLVGTNIVGSVSLRRNTQLYLYGIASMAIMAAALFFSCEIKRKRQKKEMDNLYDDQNKAYEDEKSNQYDSYAAKPIQKEIIQEIEYFEKQSTSSYLQDTYNETTCLGDCIVEERTLYGRIEGREVRIALNKLPMTVGTLKNVADILISDTAISKMHARFEEQDGRVYLCDLNSTNGTIKNGELLEINKPILLEPGDKIRFGRTTFTYS